MLLTTGRHRQWIERIGSEPKEKELWTQEDTGLVAKGKDQSPWLQGNLK